MAKPTIDVSKLQTASLDELDPNSGQQNKIEPSAYCKTNGEKYGDYPPVSWMNYWKNLVWQLLTWIVNEVIEGAFTFTGVKTFSSFPITPSSAPTTDYQVVNRKFVTDNYININTNDVSRSNTLTVASNTSSAAGKLYNDYLCDGTADDVQIQAAIDVVAAAGGGTVKLLEGTFNITTVISMKSNVTLQGQGNGTNLVKGANIDIIRVENGVGIVNVKIKDLQIDGVTASYTGNGISGDVTIFNCAYENILVKNCRSYGFYQCANIVNCVSITNAGIGFYICVNLVNCYAYGNTTSGFKSCEFGSMLKSYDNTTFGFEGCQYISTSEAYSNTVTGFVACYRLSNCKSHGNTEKGISGSTGVTNCFSLNNGTYGFDSCTGLVGNTAYNNTTANYNASYADKGTAAAAADTAAGGWNSATSP